jgi:hypothetical protein
MSLTLATLIPAVLLLAFGVPLLANHAGFAAMLKAFPRSTAAAYVFFGAGAAWFLFNIWHLSEADAIVNRHYLFAGFLVIAVLAFKCVPDFLAVRGLATLILVGAMPLLDAGYMNFAHWQINFYKVAVYGAIAAAIWLGAQPWRLRDFFAWTLARPARTRAIGATAAAYGLLLAFVAFTY